MMIFGRDPLADPEPLIRRVYAYVAYRIGAGPDAEDVTSDVFERAVRYRKNFDPRKGDIGDWLIGIARRQIAERRTAVGSAWLSASERAPDPDPEATAIQRVTLLKALERLTDRDRELVAMYYVGISAPRIAEQLDMTRNAADVALHRALARLRQELERGEAEPPGAGQLPAGLSNSL
jgi:RNA polymerase sigma factor (sigma-70 family)